jgi:hypothetical protein
MPPPENFWYCVYCNYGPHDWERYSHCIECGRLHPLLTNRNSVFELGEQTGRLPENGS